MRFNRKLSYTLLLMSCLALSGGRCIDFDSDKKSSNDRGDDNIDLVRVSREQKISSETGGFRGDLAKNDRFGSALADIGDLEGDGVRDLAVGAAGDGTGGKERGAVWILFMDSSGRVDLSRKIADGEGGFLGKLKDNDRFGSATAGIGDLNSDGVNDLAVGAPGTDENKTDQGAVWLLYLNDLGRVRREVRIADDSGGFNGKLANGDHFGAAVAAIGDLDGDGVTELAVGAPNSDDKADDSGAVWILFMDATGQRVRFERKIANKSGGFDGKLESGDRFGSAVAGIGDLNGDGIPDLAVGAPGYDDDKQNQGAIWILFLGPEGRVLDEQLVSRGAGGFDGKLRDDDHFGSAIAAPGDLDNDGTSDLAVGAPDDDDGSTNAGAVWMLFMENTGRVREQQKISSKSGGFGGKLKDDDRFGSALAGTGDLNASGLPDIATGAPGDDDGGTDKGATWMLFLSGLAAP